MLVNSSHIYFYMLQKCKVTYMPLSECQFIHLHAVLVIGKDRPTPHPLIVGILPAAKSETYYWCILSLYIFFLAVQMIKSVFQHSVNSVKVHLYIAFSIFITKQVIKLIPSLAVMMLVNWTARVNLKKFLILSINQRVMVPVVLLTP